MKISATSERRAAGERWIVPDWPTPPTVRSLITTREGGLSCGVFASFNLGAHVGDDAAAVAANRARLLAKVGAPPRWLNQVHGTRVVDATSAAGEPPDADAAFAREPGAACVVMTADCLPVLFCDAAGSVVAAAHAGWRGLLAGVLERTIAAMQVPHADLMAYLGPAIGPQAFEVGDEVRAAFVESDAHAAAAFTPGAPGKWLGDLYRLAQQRLEATGVARVFGGEYCTYGEADRFFSYRRDGQTGRMASLIWLAQ